MAKQSKTLLLMASKLGLSEEDKVLSKAAEYERLLQMKATVNNMTDTAKTVVCLDLAASYYRVDVDLKTAIKCSGLKTPTYTNSRKIIESLLELNNERLTISGLCLILQCNVQALANRILEEYQRSSKLVIDLNLPQYVCMAVYQACRISKVKVSKSKLVDKSQLKPAQWSKLDAEWTKFTDQNFEADKKKKKRSGKDTVAEEKMEVDDEFSKKKEVKPEPQIEPYENWKQRILENAYKELEREQNQNKQKDKTNKQTDKSNKQKENVTEPNEDVVQEDDNLAEQMKHSISPRRRSPRKSTNKYEPYASPVKHNAVRLLFPL